MTALTLRLLGGGFLALGGALLGRARLSELERQRRCAQELAAALGRLEGEMEMLQSPLGELFSHLSDCPFFRLVAAGFGTRLLEELWRNAAAAQPLPASAQASLASLGTVLGRCGAARQAAEIALVRRRMTEEADALTREIDARGRRFPLLGAALGAIVAAVLF